MKLKKFNTILVASTLMGAAMIYGIGGFVISQLPWSQGPLTEQAQSTSAVNAQTPIVFGSKTPFSSKGKQVVTIPWQNRFGQMPGNATLQKWTDGDRTYYRICGPINPQFADIAAGKLQDWGSFVGCEVFFQRGGGAYDQWIINPNGSMIYEHSSAAKRSGYFALSGESRLPDSRYQGSIKGDRIEVTFWCDSQDTPANIVFNYRDRIGNSPHWVSTGSYQYKPEGPGNHHWADDWNYP